jgi:striatin 1/3/4
MNPLPNRPLLNNPSAPLSLPNVPSFDQISYSGRPRKVLPEAGKEFPLLNGMNTISASTSSGTSSAGSQLSILERNPHPNSGMVQQSPLSLSAGQNSAQSQEPSSSAQTEKERDAEAENRQLTAIFRPDDAGEWKEKLRLSHEAAEKARIAKDFQQTEGPWDRQREDEDDGKEEDGEVEDEESTLIGDGEGTKHWKAKRTLRKSVFYKN